MIKSERKKVTALIIFFVSWIAWFNFARHIALSVFVKSGTLCWLYIILISVVLSGAIVCRAMKRDKVRMGKPFAVWKGAACFAFLIGLTLWNAPEVLIYILASKSVNDAETFTVVYPGPSTGKRNHCQAGIEYYDDYLQRKITLCAEDNDINISAKFIYIQRKVTAYGANISKYNFVE